MKQQQQSKQQTIIIHAEQLLALEDKLVIKFQSE